MRLLFSNSSLISSGAGRLLVWIRSWIESKVCLQLSFERWSIPSITVLSDVFWRFPSWLRATLLRVVGVVEAVGGGLVWRNLILSFASWSC